MAQGRAIYLDHNAGAKLRPAVAGAMRDLLGVSGNASSVHAPGRAARARIEAARSAVAALAGVEPANVVFTSGATEANVTALSPDWVDGRGSRSFDRLLVGACEHPSVLAGGRFAADAVETLAVDAQGRVDIARLSQRLAEHAGDGQSVLVSVMAANNETGVIQPLDLIGAAVAEAGAVLHVDAVQAAGRIPIDLEGWRADSMALSAHKIGGPQGAGALVLRNADLHPVSLLTGGGQERRKRAGTENVLAIAGFGVAARIALDEIADWDRLGGLRDGLERDLLHIKGETRVFGRDAPRLANTSCFAVPGMPAETVLIALDLEGIAVSSGSACSSGKVSSSHVLVAMGVDRDLARCALRVSLGPDTTKDEIEAFVAAWRRVSARMRTADAGRAA
ncbi:cysteine desulfurase family protein [Stappia sp. ES.058]|uniref:cysteine desulfurase family protein n=1 Tax=Stappia sp. ES.058 TaxID=1881061 RepID=UPI00087C21DA|nr:cysteine desulfurase family protein [Stappia sp. ES.058]SDU12892.1 cysteine desulfurase [Stappia sp. ES.058]